MQTVVNFSVNKLVPLTLDVTTRLTIYSAIDITTIELELAYYIYCIELEVNGK